MSLTKLILKLAAPVPKIESFERFLFVGPHPDDIEIGAGATAAKLAAKGKQICFLICADGRYGDSHTTLRGDALAAERRQEALRSARRLGVNDVRFLDFSDGGFYDTDELKKSIAGVMGDFQPDVVFAPDPCVSSECHADHLNVGQTVRVLACAAPNRGIMTGLGACSVPVQALAYYMTARPNLFVNTRGFLKAQLDAIFGCHLTQFPPQDAEARSIALYLKIRSVDFGIRALCGRAEGFRVLGQTHMHCLPEAE